MRRPSGANKKGQSGKENPCCAQLHLLPGILPAAVFLSCFVGAERFANFEPGGRLIGRSNYT